MSILADRKTVISAVQAVAWGLLPIAGALPSAAQGTGQEAVASLLGPAPQERQVPEEIDIGSLTLESDFAPFMTKNCPPGLRLKALRRLWTLMPPVVLEENPAI
jgi:Protein of unknown function (DUF3306)